jgi:hypothetical protein
VESDTSVQRSKKKGQQQTKVRMHYKKQAEEENYEDGNFSSCGGDDTRESFLPELSANSKGGSDGRRGSVVPSSLPAIVEDGADSDSYSDIGANIQVSSSIPALPKIQEKSTAVAANSKGII